MTYSKVIEAIAKDEDSLQELKDICVALIFDMGVNPYDPHDLCVRFNSCDSCESNEYQGESLREEFAHLVDREVFNKIKSDYLHKNDTANYSNDAVNHPNHYNFGKYEVIDVIEDWKLGFNLGNVIKYVARADHKGKRKEDLKKALFYLQREVDKS